MVRQKSAILETQLKAIKNCATAWDPNFRGGGQRGLKECFFLRFGIKYILYVNAFIAVTELSVQYYTYARSQNLSWHWVQKCPKSDRVLTQATTALALI